MRAALLPSLSASSLSSVPRAMQKPALSTCRFLMCAIAFFPVPTEGRLGSDSTAHGVTALNAWATGTGYQYSATTTQYGFGVSSCGAVNTAVLVQGLNYTVVASAQAMQDEFPEAGATCTWECTDGIGQPVDRCRHTACGTSDGAPIDGCSCKQVGSCWCGEASVRSPSMGTAALGCYTCAKGRFISKRPYSSNPNGDMNFVSMELNLVVADICPYGSNAKWCPAKAGEVNACGEHNHLDFSQYPSGIDNHYFVFSPAECSTELKHRFSEMSQCRAIKR